MWFNEIAKVENPGRAELSQFLEGVNHFLGFILENRNDFDFLWENAPELHDLAWDTYQYDILQGAGRELEIVIPEIPPENIRRHGLEGRPLKFKFRVLGALDRLWNDLGGLSIREWFKKIIDAIDAVLDSLIDAAAGVGGIIKEFKDSLAALA